MAKKQVAKIARYGLLRKAGSIKEVLSELADLENSYNKEHFDTPRSAVKYTKSSKIEKQPMAGNSFRFNLINQ